MAPADDITRSHDLPVELLPDEGALPKGEEGIAVCLSGGGYRAMIFHLGALWRLYEVGILGEVARFSSVSGGSITAGALPLACPADRTQELAETPTRLKRMPSELQERLTNWGYAVCDAALRKYLDNPPAPPTSFPYPQTGV